MSTSFKNLKPHQRIVKEWLRDQGATAVHMVWGGKHHRLSFQFNGGSYTHPIACTPRDPDACINSSIRQLRRKLNIKETKMYVANKPTINGVADPKKAAAEALFSKPEPFNAPKVLPARTMPTETLPAKYEGSIACYSGGQLCFSIPTDLYNAFGKSRVAFEYMGDYTWNIIKKTDGYAPFAKDSGAKYKTQAYNSAIPGIPNFNSTPAEFILTDNTILATLKEPPRIPAPKPEYKAATALADQQQEVAKKKAAEARTETEALTNTTSSTATQLPALLEAIRNVEATTDYKLIREKDTGSLVFRHNAPVIR